MDKEASKQLLEALIAEHPDLLKELIPDRKEAKTIVTSIRTTEVLMERIDALVLKLSGTNYLDYKGNKLSRSDVIRGALERGVAELEKLV